MPKTPEVRALRQTAIGHLYRLPLVDPEFAIKLPKGAQQQMTNRAGHTNRTGMPSWQYTAM
jgi:hypothetical protein